MNGVTQWALRLAVLATGLCSGCATMGTAAGFAYDADELKRSVTFETRCPPEKIEILQAMEAGIGHSKFKLRVCGKAQNWNRFGTSYFMEGKGPMAQSGMAGGGSEPAAVQAESQEPAAGRVQEAGSDSPMVVDPVTTPEPEQAEKTAPPPPGGTGVAASQPGCGCTRADYEALLRRVADLELLVSGQKTNAQLMADLQDQRDNAWKLRLDAARLLGERRAPEALTALKAIEASLDASGSLKDAARMAVQAILAATAEN